MDASVIIPTKNRPVELMHCLRALSRQNTRREFEVIVVDDGSTPAIEPDSLRGCPNARLVRSGGVGGALARNRGLREATAPLILFTDDDTAPAPLWVDAACRHLEANDREAGVEGPTVSPLFDPLYERSVRNDKSGTYWTCNVAYRREVLERIGGFSDVFPSVHGEDLDLAFRVLEWGPIGFAEEMIVTHYPTSITIRDLVGRAEHVASDMIIYRRYPDRYATRIPLALLPVVSQLRHLRGRLQRDRRAMIGSPRRLARFSAGAVGALTIALVTPLRRSPSRDR